MGTERSVQGSGQLCSAAYLEAVCSESLAVYLYININVYICVYIHVYLQGVYTKALESFLDEKPQYFPSVLNHALSRRPEEVLPNFTALLPPC